LLPCVFQQDVIFINPEFGGVVVVAAEEVEDICGVF
jgi:hypothetical protein